jgi:putative DNA primase/helicase
MKGQNMDLTKYFPEGNNLEQNKPKDTSDLINEMQSQGLRIDHLQITGEIVRVPVNEMAGIKADSGGQRSGYYVVNELNGNYFATFGNWKTSFEGKWSSVNHQAMTTQQREDLQSQLQEAKKRSEEAKKQRNNEVADKVKGWLESYANVVEHEYLTNKKIKNYGLKQHQDSLVCGVYSTTGDIRSLQYIDKKGQKKFVSNSEIKGNIFLIGADIKDIPKLDKIILAEGYSTSASIYEATQIPVACVFSANFVMAVALQIRRLSGARIIIALDNDESGVGEKKAQECVQAVTNSCVRLPSERGDFNDLYLKHGLDKVRQELTESKFNIKKYAIRNLVEKPEPQKFLVESFIPLAKPGILASSGGVGKSLSLLQLALAIAKGGTWWGKPINEHGSSVVFCAEDDLVEVHNRIDMLDPLGERFRHNNDVYVFPVPDQKEPLILLREEGITEQAQQIVEELKTIDNLKLVAFDPLQAFTTASVSQSNEAGQLWGSYCAMISANIGCTTLTTHHINKQAISNDSDDPYSHKSDIRGASSITDSVRFAISMWVPSESDAEQLCAQANIPYDRLGVVKAALVKSNSGNVDYGVQTLIRKDGILEPIESLPRTDYEINF